MDIKLGPDGAIYIADFYNRIIGHYEVPLTHPGRDRTSGRIWRIVYKGTDGKASPAKNPRRDWTEASVRRTDSRFEPSEPDRADARDTPAGRSGICMANLRPQLLAPVRGLLESQRPATARAHALWVLERLGALEDADVLTAANDKDLIVRVHALRVLAERPKLTDEQLVVVRDTTLPPNDGLVRRLAAEALGRHPGLEDPARS